MRVSLRYDKGTIVISGGFPVPYVTLDPRGERQRAQAMYYRDTLEYLRKSEVDVDDHVMDPLPMPVVLSKTKLRPYQREALRKWAEAGKRGVVVLPTGAGKTLVAVKAIELVGLSTLVVVPTLDLLLQWKGVLEDELQVEVGAIGGENDELKPITVITYDSAYLRAGELGNKFYLLIFDECHHLPSEGYRQIAEMFASPYRLGLTATPEREDGLERLLPKLIGGIVYRLSPEKLAGKYLSEYEIKRVAVDLAPEERKNYEMNEAIFKNYLKKKRIYAWGPNALLRLIMLSATDKEAREALLARNKAMQIAFNSEAKLEVLEQLLRENPNDKIIIFTQYNDLVYEISRRFLIPFITYKTSDEERDSVLSAFKEGKYKAIVASKVLDEGVDVPEASLGIIVSGSGSRREFVQRLGRLLRKREGKVARLIEIVSRDTGEVRLSARRKRGNQEEESYEEEE
ncbi:MAG: DEAD/DEAH box helicase [Thermoprotei archaeon]